MQSITELLPMLQSSIGPAILISAIGLLLLTMTNRLAHLIDRIRALNGTQQTDDPAIKSKTETEIQILLRRAHLLRDAILWASASALCSATLIMVIFLFTLLSIDFAAVLIFLFIGSMICFMAAIFMLIMDVNVSLKALEIEV